MSQNHMKPNAARDQSSLQYVDKRSVVRCHCAGNDDINKKVLNSRRKATCDGASRTNGGREAAGSSRLLLPPPATHGRRSSSVVLMDGTINSDVSADRR